MSADTLGTIGGFDGAGGRGCGACEGLGEGVGDRWGARREGGRGVGGGAGGRRAGGDGEGGEARGERPGRGRVVLREMVEGEAAEVRGEEGFGVGCQVDSAGDGHGWTDPAAEGGEGHAGRGELKLRVRGELLPGHAAVVENLGREDRSEKIASP